MRVIASIILITAVCGTCIAQEAPANDGQPDILVSKRGKPILPVKGEFSIGLDASTFLEYLGNMFNNTASNPAPVVQSPFSPSLVVKYMKNDKTAIRVRFALNNLSSEGKNLVDNTASPDPTILVTDTKTYGSTNILLGMGIEKRRGNGRLQGIYGVEGFVGFTSTTSKYTYGNAISTANPFVSFTLWNPNSATVASTTIGSSRTLETSSGTSVSFGVTGFIGAEYFVAPKISVGGELGYSIASTGSGTGIQKIESYNFSTSTTVVTQADYFPTPSTFSFGTVPTGSIFLNLYL